MTTTADLLLTICRDPHNMDARLIYADHLDDLHKAERAEFIRVQIELDGAIVCLPVLDALEMNALAVDREPPWFQSIEGTAVGAFVEVGATVELQCGPDAVTRSFTTRSRTPLGGGRYEYEVRLEGAPQTWARGAADARKLLSRERLEELQECERELLRGNQTDPSYWGEKAFKWFREPLDEFLGRDSVFDVRRGFVESISCDCATWVQHGPAIVLMHPIREVTLTDKAPDYEDWPGSSTWYDEKTFTRRGRESDIVPHEIFELIEAPGQSLLSSAKVFNSHTAAEQAIGPAALQWARRKAGLDLRCVCKGCLPDCKWCKGSGYCIPTT